MGRGREDRLQLRRIEWLAGAAALAAGGALPPGTLSGDAGRLLVTFLGLVGASILPTISLVLGSMTTSGRSVQGLDKLRDELAAAMDALLLIFGLVGVSVVGLLSLAVPTPDALAEVPYLSGALERSGHALVAAVSVLIVMRSGQVPGILRRSLTIRHEIAVEDARRKTLENAPTPIVIREAFSTHLEFGKTVNLADLKRREP